MKHAHFLLLAVIALAACNPQNTPERLHNGTVDFNIHVSKSYPVRISCANHSVQELALYSWNFGDGTVIIDHQTGQPTHTRPIESPYDQVSHTYAKGGTYTVTLTCRDYYGFEYSDTASVTVGQDAYSKAEFIGFELHNLAALAKDSFCIYFDIALINSWGDTTKYATKTSQKISRADGVYNCKLDKPALIGEMPNPFDYYKQITATAYCDSIPACKTVIDKPATLENTWVYSATDTTGLKLDLIFFYE